MAHSDKQNSFYFHIPRWDGMCDEVSVSIHGSDEILTSDGPVAKAIGQLMVAFGEIAKHKTHTPSDSDAGGEA